MKPSIRGDGLAAHLLNDRDNNHVTVIELRGFASDDLEDALQAAFAVSKATRCKQFLFSLSLHPPKETVASEEGLPPAADWAEQALGLEGSPVRSFFMRRMRVVMPMWFGPASTANL
ncbi:MULTISPECIES: hypothetical protein [unclassified Roseibium]|uniref:hypothetical protein n=1 Tax=unclassified Roseibium TaxID=2629323 RepID=UPI00273D2914|nr:MULTISPECIES: hypothetical protein [unclassified Roseibium]